MTTADKIAERNKFFQGHAEEVYKLERDFSSVQLRKKKRLEHVNKRRTNTYRDEAISSILDFPSFIIPESLEAKHPELTNVTLNSAQRLRILVSLIKASPSAPDKDLLECMNRLISRTKDFPISQVFDESLISIFMTGLQTFNESLINPILNCLINIFSENQEQVHQLFINKGFVNIAKEFLAFSANEYIIENTLWALANLMAENKNVSRLVYDLGVWKEFLRFCVSCSLTLRSLSQWVLSNLSKDKYFTEAENAEVIAIAKNGLFDDREDVIKDTLWTLNYLVNSDDLIDHIFRLDIDKQLIPLMKHYSSAIQYPVLKLFANISTSSNEQVFRYLIQINFLTPLSTLLTHPEQKIKSEVLFIFSNFLAASEEVVELITFLPCFKVIVGFLNSEKFKVKKETVCAVCNALCCKNWKVVCKVQELGAIPKLVECLHHNSAEIIVWVLDALIHILSTAQAWIDLDRVQEFFSDLQQMDGFSRLDSLMHSPNREISEKALKVLNFL